MTTAFQSDAFQDNAFQIGDTAPNVGGSEKSRRAQIRRNQTPKKERVIDDFDEDLMSIAIAVIGSGVLH